MLKDNYKGINTLRKLLELVLLIFTTRKDMYFWADYLWMKEIMNYIFITTKECYSISIMLNEAVFNKLSHFLAISHSGALTKSVYLVTVFF